MINSPFKWVGGKSRLRKHIISAMDPHSCYLEVFSGAAWVLFGKDPSDVEILNDIDSELVNFFSVVRESPESLIEAFDWELVSRERFDALADADVSQLDRFARAHRFYYLIMAGWGGELNYPRFQTSVSDGGHGNRLVGAIKTLRDRLRPVHDRLKTVLIENLSWEDCIARYDREGVLMYLDPPYPNNKCNYLHNMRDWADHERMAERLKTSKAKWILSSYDVPEVHELYAGSFVIPVQSMSGMRVTKAGTDRVVNREVLLLNYEPQATQQSKVPHAQKLRKNAPIDQVALEL